MGALELVRLHAKVSYSALGVKIMEIPEIVPITAITRATLHRLSPFLPTIGCGG